MRHLIPSLLQCSLGWAGQSATQTFHCDLTPVGDKPAGDGLHAQMPVDQ